MGVNFKILDQRVQQMYVDLGHPTTFATCLKNNRTSFCILAILALLTWYIMDDYNTLEQTSII